MNDQEVVRCAMHVDWTSRSCDASVAWERVVVERWLPLWWQVKCREADVEKWIKCHGCRMKIVCYRRSSRNGKSLVFLLLIGKASGHHSRAWF